MNSENKTWESLKAEYLHQVEKALSLVNHPRSKDVLEDVSSHLDRRFAELGPDQHSWENFQAIITDMGPPSEYAELLDIGQPLKKQRPSLKFVVLAAVVLGIGVATILILPKFYQPDQDPYETQPVVKSFQPRPFVNDPRILGNWESVDFVRSVGDFEPGTKKWQEELFLKNIKFMKNGRTSLPALNWSKDWIYDRNTTKKAQYQIKVIGGEPYLFFPWLAPSRGKPPYYVLQKASSVKPLSSGTHNAANDKAVEVAITVPRQCDQNDVVSKEVSANSDPEPITDGLTELQRKRLPIRGRELKLLKKLADVATAWVSKSEQSSKVEVDRLIGLLLAQPNPSVDVYFASAKIANLCGQPDKAISILEDVVAKHGRDDAPGFAEPIDLVAYHWIGRIARHSGNTAKAISAYETILQNAKNLEGINQIGHVVSCKLYLAEMALENIKDKDLVVKRLDEIIQIIESIDIKMKEQWSLFLGWAKYQRSVITDGKIRARQQLVGGDSRERGMACMTAASQLSITGVAAEGSSGLRTTNRQDREILPAASIRRVAQGGRSRLDTSLVRLFVGRVEEMEKSTEAEKYYSALFEEDSFFSPMGGIGLARCEKQRGKIDEANELLEQVRLRYPGYGPAVQKLKESWEEKP